MQDLPRPKSSSTDMSRASLAAPHREARLGFILSGAFFIGLLGWAAFVPLDAGAMADGIVAVSGNRQVVQHRDGGVITDLYVTEGQTVRAGQPLLRVATPELVASERAMTSEVVSLLARRARLAAERDGRGELTEPAEFANLPAADVALAQEALAGQRQLLKARRASIQTERAVLSQRVRQQSEQIGGLSHQMGSNREQSRLLGEELEGMKRLLPDGFVAVNRIRAMERNVSELDGQYGALRADTARTSEAIGETRLQMVSLDRIRLEEITTELGELQQRLDEIQPKLDAMREQVAGSIIRAPTGGKVVGLTTFTIGGVVAAGATIMEIVPQDRALVVEAKAAPTDADDLRVGMKTQVRFSALQERNLPILEGAVTRVSADSFEDERTGARYFEIEIVVPPAELDKIRQIRGDTGLRAGLPAEVLVPLRSRSALSYLLEPLTQTLWRAGREH
ncbi:HlyD family type I secretion periplasmic adaptor subunit [Brevundimonas sp. P7753]|uniref:HlyD family type I secretion periplasmic adaptor subunit n=1 Tax=Brevundimonas sp. P7753 TaxID=2726982 RepID=UPI0015B87BF9|nr:HlyD family type I secretion periplasmic adaptor subunit [Brevundimonas sp. P7753]NWE52707.1 HlyD family type I secretion periplasmic adaptor subunit [Brevundimonas sp. P7753]